MKGLRIDFRKLSATFTFCEDSSNLLSLIKVTELFECVVKLDWCGRNQGSEVGVDVDFCHLSEVTRCVTGHGFPFLSWTEARLEFITGSSKSKPHRLDDVEHVVWAKLLT